MPSNQAVLDYLRRPDAVRERSENVFCAGLRDELEHFQIRLERLPEIARKVIEVTRATYPDLDIPYHGRFRHFDAAGVPRLRALDETLSVLSVEEQARSRFDLVVTSVLLDAGAGERWCYREPDTGIELRRSEGLAVASFHMFLSGAFSEENALSLRATASGLRSLTADALTSGMQVEEGNPLIGLPGRLQLLRSLGEALEQRPDLFGRPARFGNLFDTLRAKAERGRLPARAILTALLDGLSSIWPARRFFDGMPLGDVWPHPRAGGVGASAGLVPFHKLSQWLAYSLIEPLEMAGMTVDRLDDLTGLAEYRNGGLFVDMGVLVPRREETLARTHAAGSELVVEWRALTVALIDRVADAIRDALGMDRTRLPLAKILEGGTWRAGRAVARERRQDGAPPIRVESDGTVL